jgi:hypothetical protein
MRLPYTATITTDLLGEIVTDFDCEIEVSSELDCGSMLFTVDGIYRNGKWLFGGTALETAIALEICEQAETALNTDGTRLRQRAIEREFA